MIKKFDYNEEDMKKFNESLVAVIEALRKVALTFTLGYGWFRCIEIDTTEGDPINMGRYENTESIKLGWGDPTVTSDYYWITIYKDGTVFLDTYEKARGGGLCPDKHWDSLEEAMDDAYRNLKNRVLLKYDNKYTKVLGQ